MNRINIDGFTNLNDVTVQNLTLRNNEKLSDGLLKNLLFDTRLVCDKVKNLI